MMTTQSRVLVNFHSRSGRPHSSSCCLIAILLIFSGCSSNRIKFWEESVLETDLSKEQLVEHLNRNILGTDSTPGVAGWRTSDAKISVTGIPVPLPASLAVKAPRNLRIIVSNPLSGGQELDLGANHERFWLWTKDQSEMITFSHDDADLALQQLKMPIQIQPEWLVEVFGVIPINGDEYTLEHPEIDEPVLDLVSVRTSPTGKHVERIIRVNTFSGYIQEHILRNSDGEIIASAKLDRYTKMPNGTVLPRAVKISWPAEKTEMKISLGHPEVNPPGFHTEKTLWTMPNIPDVQVVDIGEIARRRAGVGRRGTKTVSGDNLESNIRQLRHVELSERKLAPGNVKLAPSVRLQAPEPFETEAPQAQRLTPQQIPTAQQIPTDGSLPEWARTHTTQKPVSSSATWRRSTNSGAAWRSSSAQLLQAQE